LRKKEKDGRKACYSFYLEEKKKGGGNAASCNLLGEKKGREREGGKGLSIRIWKKKKRREKKKTLYGFSFDTEGREKRIREKKRKKRIANDLKSRKGGKGRRRGGGTLPQVNTKKRRGRGGKC